MINAQTAMLLAALDRLAIVVTGERYPAHTIDRVALVGTSQFQSQSSQKKKRSFVVINVARVIVLAITACFVNAVKKEGKHVHTFPLGRKGRSQRTSSPGSLIRSKQVPKIRRDPKRMKKSIRSTWSKQPLESGGCPWKIVHTMSYRHLQHQ